MLFMYRRKNLEDSKYTHLLLLLPCQASSILNYTDIFKVENKSFSTSILEVNLYALVGRGSKNNYSNFLAFRHNSKTYIHRSVDTSDSQSTTARYIFDLTNLNPFVKNIIFNVINVGEINAPEFSIFSAI